MFMQSREAVRVKVKKYEGKHPPELQKFSVDPQITSLEVLQSILAKAFNLKGDFSLSYKSTDDFGQEDYLALFSDWDLDAAFLRAQNASSLQGNEPCVHLRVDVKALSDSADDWEAGADVNSVEKLSKQPQETPPGVFSAPQQQDGFEPKQSQTGFQGLFMNQMEKTLSLVTRAFNLSEDPNIPLRQPLSDAEFRSFLDPVGQVIQATKLREVIYCGGIDPSLRRVVWKHILNVYPDGMSGKERMDYMKKKSSEYFSLRDVWRDCIQKGQVSSDLAYVTSMVKKDVLRTDRHHKFYAGSDDNKNIGFLFNILTTYALNHPLVSYCQGMSDLASPLLVTMDDEAHAYICLCALMTRLYPNFLLDGEAMTLKFTHLTESLQVYDPQFYKYLKSQQADDLLFCYRWLLLEMKREFAFEDSLRMLEVLWSTLPPFPPEVELSLVEKTFSPTFFMDGFDEPPISPLLKTPRDNAYTKLCAIRRQNSSVSLITAARTKITTYKRMNHSLDENIGKRNVMTSTLQYCKEFQSLDDAALHTKSSDVELATDLKAQTSQSVFNFNKTNDLTTECGNENIGCNVNINKSNSISGDMEILIKQKGIDSGHNSMKSPTSISAKFQNRENLQRFAMNNHLMSSLDQSDLSTSSVRETDNPTKKLIKSLDEFKNFTIYSKKNINKPKDLTKECSITKISSNKMNLLQKCDDFGNSIENIVQEETNHSILESEDDDSSPDDSKDYSPMTTSMTTELRLELECLDRQVLGNQNLSNDEANSSHNNENPVTENTVNNSESNNIPNKTVSSNFIKLNERSIDNVFVWENPLHGKSPGQNERKETFPKPSDSSSNDVTSVMKDHCKGLLKLNTEDSLESPQTEETALKQTLKKEMYDNEQSNKIKNMARESMKTNSKFFSNMSQELENAKRNCEILLTNKRSANLHSIAATITNFQKKYDLHSQPPLNVNDPTVNGTNSCEEVSETNYSKQIPTLLPSPNTFGGGNPFLMFLCLTVLMQHRDFIMRNQMDYNELAMHFDKMVRKHNVNRVLNQARRMYSQYLKHQNDCSNPMNM